MMRKTGVLALCVLLLSGCARRVENPGPPQITILEDAVIEVNQPDFSEDMLRAYFQVEKRLKPEERSSLRALIAQVMQNSRDLYTKMSCDLRGSEYGLGYDREAFHREIAIEAMGCANMQAALDGHEAYLASVRRMPLRPLAGWVKRKLLSLVGRAPAHRTTR